MVMHKRGQELTLGTVILIVLGIAVLIFLIFGFSSGWGNLWDRITNFAGGKANLDTIKTGCELACAQNSVSDWCGDRTVKFGKSVNISNKQVKTFVGNCGNFSTSEDLEKVGLNVESCGLVCA